MYIPNRKKVVAKGQVLHWTIKFDGRDGLEVPISIEVKIDQLPNGAFGLTLGPNSNLPINSEVVALFRPHNLHHAKLYWIEKDNMMLEYGGETYWLFAVEELTADSATLYFHAYLPAEFGGGVIIYDKLQNLESAKA